MKDAPAPQETQKKKALERGVLNDSFLEIQDFETEKYAAPVVAPMLAAMSQWTPHSRRRASCIAFGHIHPSGGDSGQLGEQRARKLRDNLH